MKKLLLVVFVGIVLAINIYGIVTDVQDYEPVTVVHME